MKLYNVWERYYQQLSKTGRVVLHVTQSALLIVTIILLSSCTRDTTPTPTDEPTPTQEVLATLDVNNPHDGLPTDPPTEIVTNANLVGNPEITTFHFEGVDRNVNYPRGFFPVCEPFNIVGTRYPCSYVDTPDTVDGIYEHEGNFLAGYFGLELSPVVTLRPSDNYRYIVRCDISDATFGNDSYGVVVRFLSDEFDGGVYTFPRSDTGRNSHVFVFEVSEPLVITYQCGMDIDWATRELTWSMGYMGLQIVAPDYGNSDFVTLP